MTKPAPAVGFTRMQQTTLKEVRDPLVNAQLPGVDRPSDVASLSFLERVRPKVKSIDFTPLTTGINSAYSLASGQPPHLFFDAEIVESARQAASESGEPMVRATLSTDFAFKRAQAMNTELYATLALASENYDLVIGELKTALIEVYDSISKDMIEIITSPDTNSETARKSFLKIRDRLQGHFRSICALEKETLVLLEGDPMAFGGNSFPELLHQLVVCHNYIRSTHGELLEDSEPDGNADYDQGGDGTPPDNESSMDNQQLQIHIMLVNIAKTLVSPPIDLTPNNPEIPPFYPLGNIRRFLTDNIVDSFIKINDLITQLNITEENEDTHVCIPEPTYSYITHMASELLTFARQIRLAIDINYDASPILGYIPANIRSDLLAG